VTLISYYRLYYKLLTCENDSSCRYSFRVLNVDILEISKI